MAELLDERTLREGAAILAALDAAGMAGDIRQTSAYVDDQRDPTQAEYDVTLKRGGDRFGVLHGSAKQILSLLGLLARGVA